MNFTIFSKKVDENFDYSILEDKNDKDSDGLFDVEEIKLRLNPKLKDSDGNGILDCNEKIYQEFRPNLEFDENSPVVGITVAFSGTGDISKKTTVTDMLDIDVLLSGVYTLVGSPYEFVMHLNMMK